MDNKTFAIAANKFFYYAMNYRAAEVQVETFSGVESHYLPEFFNAFPLALRAHLMNKWNAINVGSYGNLMAFYGELDGTNRVRMLKWINENFEQADNYGLSLTAMEEE